MVSSAVAMAKKTHCDASGLKEVEEESQVKGIGLLTVQ